MSLVAPPSVNHDRDPAVHDRNATTVLSDALDRLRLRGAIFLQAEFSEPWAYESMPLSDLGALFLPDARQIILFHVIAQGRCWVETEGGDRLWAAAGDVVVFPYGDQHRMGGEQDAVLVAASSLVQPPPWERMPLVQYGAGDDTLTMVCGYLTSDVPLFDRRLGVFPPAFVVTPAGPARAWVQASIDYAVQQTTQVGIDRFEVPVHVPELLLAEVLRLHLAGAPAADQGLLLALRDPVLAPALAAIHEAPQRKWTVAELAARSAVSVSLLDERFRAVLAMPPIRYLTGWRMHLAEDLLQGSDLGVGAVARRVGYESEEAFSRAFKRLHGTSPARWRVSA